MPRDEAREIRMFGTTVADIDQDIARKDGYDRLRYATSVLSDAQEVLARGDAETSRQFMNVAKYVIDTVAQELR
jgi:predicted polyphosphate/ATP-dependent NAD kinase